MANRGWIGGDGEFDDPSQWSTNGDGDPPTDGSAFFEQGGSISFDDNITLDIMDS